MRTSRRALIAFVLVLLLTLLPATTMAVTVPRAANRTIFHVPVLLYHRIAPSTEIGTSLPELVLSPQIFESHMRALKNDGWTTVTAATLSEHLQSGVPLPKKTMVITIDDGRSDGYIYALPILKRLGFVATFYVITGRVGRARYLTVPQLRSMSADGMEIANHTLSHSPIKVRTDAYYLNEVRVAQEQLTGWLGAPPVTFAYPFGLHPAGLVQAVGSLGLRLGFTTVTGHTESLSTALTAPRMRIGMAMTPDQVVWLMDHLK